jgi:hypothetical protein
MTLLDITQLFFVTDGHQHSYKFRLICNFFLPISPQLRRLQTIVVICKPEI